MQVEKRWIIKGSRSGLFIGVDSPSGGYPYATDFWGAEKFRSIEDANLYVMIGFSTLAPDTWQIYETDEIGMRYVPYFDPYEAELAALKKKYGKA